MIFISENYDIYILYIIIFLTYIVFPCNLRGSSTSDSSDSGSESVAWLGQSSEVSLKLSNLESYHQINESTDASQFAANGADPKRIQRVLKDPGCPCKCTMPFRTLLKICQFFWGLPKTSQDSILWSLQCSSGRKQWLMEGPVPCKFQ